MLPFNVPTAYPPSWVDLLRDAVLWPDRHWVPGESVSILLRPVSCTPGLPILGRTWERPEVGLAVRAC